MVIDMYVFRRYTWDVPCRCFFKHIRVFPKIVGFPKWIRVYNGKSYFEWMIWGGQTHHLRKHPAFLVPQLEPCRRLVRLDVPWPFLSCGSGPRHPWEFAPLFVVSGKSLSFRKTMARPAWRILHEFSHQIWTVDPLLRKLFTRGMGHGRHRNFRRSLVFGTVSGHNSWTETTGTPISGTFPWFFLGVWKMFRLWLTELEDRLQKKVQHLCCRYLTG